MALLASCGDDVTNISEPQAFSQVKKFKELPKCEEDAEGSFFYVKDSSKVYACTADGWIQLNGKDGEDGKNGKDGKNGNDGSSCTAKANNSKTGVDIICNGKTVGTIENGTNGEDGKNGKDGSSCTAKANNSKTGFDIVCGDKTMGTIKNGSNGEDGEDGTDCSLTENENGQVIVTCGEKSATLFKASCGIGSYDPATQFCANDTKVYALCHKGDVAQLNYDGTYDVSKYFCDATDTLVTLCNGEAYDITTEFCGEAGVDKLCTTVAEGIEAAELNEDGTYDQATYFCDAKGVLNERCGGEAFDTDLQFCDEGAVAALCGSETYDLTTQMCVNGKIEEAIACCIPDGQSANWCAGHKESNYDVRTQFCDNRDGQPYTFKEITHKDDAGKIDYSETWMTENLKYANTKEGESACFKDIENNCSTSGRLYTWEAALSYCPDGWHLPSVANFNALKARDLGVEINDYVALGQGTYDPATEEITWEKHAHLYMWTSDEIDEGNATSAYLREDGFIHINTSSSYYRLYKEDLFSVRCIKDKAAAK